MTNNISRVVAQSEVRDFIMSMWEVNGCVRILESIQWKSLRLLSITMKPGTLETSVLRDGVKKMPGKVDLESFVFIPCTDTPLTLPHGDLLQASVADMTLERTLSLFG